MVLLLVTVAVKVLETNISYSSLGMECAGLFQHTLGGDCTYQPACIRYRVAYLVDGDDILHLSILVGEEHVVLVEVVDPVALGL